jgi:hypothetical protein
MPDRLESGDPVSKNWPKINRALDLHDASKRRANRTPPGRTRLKTARPRQRSPKASSPSNSTSPNPFRYPPTSSIQDEPEIAWRTFLVRAGRVEDKVLDGDGCDYYDDDPDSDYYPTGVDGIPGPNPTSHPHRHPGRHRRLLVLDRDQSTTKPATTAPTAPANGNRSCATATDPTDNDDAENDWETFPKSDGLHIPIGYIDTKTTPGVAIVRQLLRADIFPAYKVNACDENNNPIKLHIPAAFKEPDAPQMNPNAQTVAKRFPSSISIFHCLSFDVGS